MKFVCNRCKQQFEANATERDMPPSQREQGEAGSKGKAIAKVRCRNPDCRS